MLDHHVSQTTQDHWKHGGLLVFQEPMAGTNHPPRFPVIGSRDEAHHFLRKPDQMPALIEASGFRKGPLDMIRPKHSIQKIGMGDDLLSEIMRARKLNNDKKRLAMVQAVFERI